jgi:hypothetical protein
MWIAFLTVRSAFCRLIGKARWPAADANAAVAADQNLAWIKPHRRVSPWIARRRGLLADDDLSLAPAQEIS